MKVRIDQPGNLAPLDSPPIWFDQNGEACEQGPRSFYRGDPDGWLMGHRDRGPADEPTYGLFPVEVVDCLARIVVQMHDAGYWPRP